MKGRRLKSPRTDEVRPTSDKVKEAVFSMLLPWMQHEPVCMDVFAGSGNLGLEAISRGASKVYFSDISRESLALCRENATLCGVQDRCVFLSGDFRANIRRVKEAVDIFFLDPPYADRSVAEALQAIEEAENSRAGTLAVCEHHRRDELPEELAGFHKIRERRYGATSITIYERE